MPAPVVISAQRHVSGGHTTCYLAAGPEDGPLIFLVHGWPELSRSWRHQLPVLGGLGFRAVAPDMRGYGGSTVYHDHEAYAQQHIVADMVALHDHLGGQPALWVGHDWGSPVVWNMARHFPARCRAVASLCVPYRTVELGLDHLITLVNRQRYPEAEFPAGQWEYMRFYEENFEAARASLEANGRNTVLALFRRGDPAGYGQPAATAYTRRMNGWFGGGGAPEMPRDDAVIGADDLDAYTEALGRNGFFGPDSWYVNHAANAAWAATVVDDSLTMPVLFIAARYDTVCDAMTSDLPLPMRAACADLTEAVVDSGHWMAQERPFAVNAHLVAWLSAKRLLPGVR